MKTNMESTTTMESFKDTECSLDDFIKERLKSCQVTSKGMITGYLESRKAYDELFRDLKVLGCRYSVRSCYAGKTDTGNLQYKTMSPDLQIPFTGSPFHVEGTTYFLCTHGFRYYKSKTSADQEADENNGSRKKRRKVNESIKLGCPAKMTVKCIRVYPDYKTSADSWRRKCDVLKRLKADLKLTPPPRYELNFWIAVSPESTHTHERTATQRIQPLHPDIITEIHKLVRRGITSVPVIKAQLSTYVDSMFRKSSIHPDRFNTAFYPSDKSIYNHVYDAKVAISKEQIEERNQQTTSSSPPSSITPAVSPVTRKEHPEKCDSDLAAIPVETTFTADWQDQAVLPSNLVQVVNNNVTLMLMVTQPLGDQIVGRVENSVIDSPTALVNIDDNLYTVISDPSDQRILHINPNSSILMSQSCADQIGEVSTVEENNQIIAVNSDKDEVVDIDRVITMEGNVIMGVRSSSNVLEDKDETSCNEDHSQYLFVGEDSQNELLKDVSSEGKEFTALCALPQTQSLKIQEDNIFSSYSKENFIEKNTDDICRLNDKKDGKSIKSRKEMSADTKSCQQEDKSFPYRKALRDSAQDIINMSYRSVNSTLLQKMVRVFERYRMRMRAEIELKEKIESNEHESLSEIKATNQGHSQWKTSGKARIRKHQKTSKSSKDMAKKKSKKLGRTIYSSSESSISDYDDLVIRGYP